MIDCLILIGGPCDGLEVRAELTGIPHTIRASPGMPPPVNAPTYRLEHAGDGAPSRDDQGRIRYRLEAAL